MSGFSKPCVHVFPFSAPENFTFVNITSNSVGILVEEAREENVIKRYEANVKGGQQSCIIHGRDDPLLCIIGGLSPSHDYTVGVRACVPGSGGCGTALEKSFRTK